MGNKKPKIKPNLKSKESREFWKFIRRKAKESAKDRSWQRGII